MKPRIRKKYQRLIIEFSKHRVNTKYKLLREFMSFVQDEKYDLSDIILAKQMFTQTSYFLSKTRSTQTVYRAELNKFVAFVYTYEEQQMFPEHHVEVVVPVEKKEQPVTEEATGEEKSIEEEIGEAKGEYKEFLRKYQEWRGKE